MVHVPLHPDCPACRARAILEWIEASIPDVTMPQAKFDPRINPEAGQEVLRRTVMGIPSNVGQLTKPSKFLWEELGGTAPKKKRKQSANGKKRRRLMSKNLRIANQRGRKKNGEYKKGWGQSKIMATAHRMTRREMNA